jgi:hypothetical protein
MVSLIGCFTELEATVFPTVVQPFSAFSTLTSGVGEGTIELLLSRLDTGAGVFVYRGKQHFPDELAEVRFTIRFPKFSFPAPAIYEFTLLGDGEWVARCPLRLFLKENLE